jgi:MFS family permease
MQNQEELEKDLEITAFTSGTAPLAVPGRVLNLFPALGHRNYQLYVAGQSISSTGFWLQAVGIGWLVFQITGSPFWVGVAAAASGIPFLLFSIFAGVFIDRADKRVLLLWTQSIEAAVAFILSVMIFTDNVFLPAILTLAFISGTAGSIDLPARFAFVVDMVGKKDLASANSLNIGVFNATRFIGPALAGVLIAGFGVGWAFLLNAISFIPAIVALTLIKPVFSTSSQTDKHPIDSLKEGLSFSFKNKHLLALMLMSGITAFFIWPYQTLMPAVAEKVFAAGASGLGSLLASAGAGSLAGSLFVSIQVNRRSISNLIFIGVLFASLSLISFALARNFLVGHFLLFLAGFGAISIASSINTSVQLLSPDQMRGRVMAVYMTMFVGMMTLGNTFAGFFAEKTSTLFAIGFGGAAVLLAGSILYFRKAFS